MANSLNKVQLIGNLTRDPETRMTPNGQQVTTFGLATNRTWNDQSGQKQERAEFHNIVGWGKLAEIMAKYLVKGKKVYIEGRLQTRDWEAQDGSKRSRTEIVAENLIMLDKPSGERPFGGGQTSDSNQPPTPEAEDTIQLDDIPF
jgi:single-strand DNA-binding protein